MDVSPKFTFDAQVPTENPPSNPTSKPPCMAGSRPVCDQPRNE